MEILTEQSLSLYERLGEAEGIRRLVEDIVEAHMNNPVIKARFLPYRDTPERMHHVKEMLVQFLCAGSGGMEKYTGRDMVETHKGMNISETEYIAAIDDIMKTLQKHNIDRDTQKDILFISYSLKNQIIRK
ncbi:group 1 truncated hemoglobin [Ilyomonas limi]|uniref:Group 1 truncated hemoglobin n=1 Tax=Ilyomonas limi TaxID=2575867 RepID=A0A4U3KZ71_9BACT|nr:group 1 truncated hemoglobin [Ilyomonas limi]TKK67958.1 group 1 truncated hemoglobin [Ilyomonas limi]